MVCVRDDAKQLTRQPGMHDAPVSVRRPLEGPIAFTEPCHGIELFYRVLGKHFKHVAERTRHPSCCEQKHALQIGGDAVI